VDYDFIILGAGAMGTATAFELIRLYPARKILLLDRFAPPHGMGSHHGDVRMFRMTYYEHPAYVPWLKKAQKSWTFYGQMVGRRWPSRSGGLYMGPPNSDLIQGAEDAARQHGLSVTRMTREEIRAKYPLFEVPEGHVGLFDYYAGYIECERAISGLLKCCHSLTTPLPGSKYARPEFTLMTDTPVLSWESDGTRATVRTDKGEFSAKHLVITAGAWASQVLKDVDVQLTVTRQVQGWVGTEEAKLEKYPCWAFDPGDGSLFYGFPALKNAEGRLEVKCARHAKGAVVDPDTRDRAVTPADLDDFMPLVRKYLPSLADGEVRASVCLYTNSPDGHYLVDYHPKHKNVLFAAGLSGHGFKAAPAVAEMLKLMMEKPEKGHPAWFFSLERLKGPTLRLVGRR
jgi:sarcosine oxidase